MASDKTPHQFPEDGELFKHLAETSDLVFWFTALHPERVLYVSPAFERIWGHTAEALYHCPRLWVDVIHDDDRPAVIQAFGEWIAGRRETYELEYRIVRPDGAWRWIFDQGTRVYNAAGEVYRVSGVARDITERRLAEAALRESESRYRSVIDALAEGVVLIDRSGIIWSSNAAATKILGIARETLVGLSLLSTDWQAIHENGAPFAPDSFPILQTLKSGVAQENVTMGLRQLNGEVRWISINTQPIHEPGVAQPLAAVASFQDITERKRSELELHRAHQMVRAAIDASPEAMVVIDREARVQLWNPAAESIFGWRAEEVLGRPLPIVPPEAKERFLAGVDWQIENLGSFREVEEVRQHRNGTLVPVSVSTAPLRDDTGQVTAILGILSDITERKQAEAARQESEERFRQLAEHIESVFWLVEWPSQKPLYVSPAYERMWGRTRQSLYEHPESWSAAIHPDDRERSLRYFTEHATTGHCDQEYRVIPGPGQVHWVRDRAFPIRDASGRIYRVAGIVSDVTERRQYEEQLRQREAELAHVARVSTLGEMAAQLAHEMNQPLYAISNFAEACLTMLQSPGPPLRQELEENARRIASLSQRAAAIVKRMQQFARRHEPESAALDLNATVTETLALLEPTVQKAEVKLNLQLAPDLPPAWADAILVEQVLVNLIRNGLEAMQGLPASERVLELRTRQAAQGQLQVSVSDRGPGLPPGNEQEVFEPFFTTKPTGLGLGLAISKTAIESHSGRLWAENNTRSPGATFHFVLPGVAAHRTTVFAKQGGETG